MYPMDQTESEKLNDRAEAYLCEMLSKVGCMGDGRLSIDFTLGHGADLWAELKAQREKAGRPKPR